MEPRRSLYGRLEKCGIQRCWSPGLHQKLHIEGRICGLSPRMRLHPGKRPSTSATKPAAGRAGLEIFGQSPSPDGKAVTSLQPLIESFTHPNAIVLDPFAGSGSTCVAALQSGRRYIGIELLEQYHRAGQQRLAAVQRAMQQGAANDDWFMPEAA